MRVFRKTLAVALLTSAGVLGLPLSTQAQVGYWPCCDVVRYELNGSLPFEMDPFVHQSFYDWSQLGSLLYSNTYVPFEPYRAVVSMESLPEQILAGTIVSKYYNGEIWNAELMVNWFYYGFGDFHFDTSWPSSMTYDFYTLMLHEVGHVSGLDEDWSNYGSVMNPLLARGEMRRSFSMSDLSTFSSIYWW